MKIQRRIDLDTLPTQPELFTVFLFHVLPFYILRCFLCQFANTIQVRDSLKDKKDSIGHVLPGSSGTSCKGEPVTSAHDEGGNVAESKTHHNKCEGTGLEKGAYDELHTERKRQESYQVKPSVSETKMRINEIEFQNNYIPLINSCNGKLTRKEMHNLNNLGIVLEQQQLKTKHYGTGYNVAGGGESVRATGSKQDILGAGGKPPHDVPVPSQESPDQSATIPTIISDTHLKKDECLSRNTSEIQGIAEHKGSLTKTKKTQNGHVFPSNEKASPASSIFSETTTAVADHVDNIIHPSGEGGCAPPAADSINSHLTKTSYKQKRVIQKFDKGWETFRDTEFLCIILIISRCRLVYDIVLQYLANHSNQLCKLRMTCNLQLLHSLLCNLVAEFFNIRAKRVSTLRVFVKDIADICNRERVYISVFPMRLHEFFLRKANGPPFPRGEEFRFEAVRLWTFRDMPSSIPVPTTRLARAGFYYSGEEDEVVCFSCGGRLREWARGDDPAVRHRNFYPDCRLVRGTDTENVPLFPAARVVSNDNTGANIDPFPNLANTRSTPRDQSANAPSLLSSQQALFRPLGISSPEVANSQITSLESSTVAHAGVASGVRSNENTSAPLTPPNTSHLPSHVSSQMRNESDRLATFVNWPSGASVQPRDLARAGFFYVGTEDRVQCAFCEGILRNWEPGDQPLQEHRRYLSTCPFVMGLEVGNIPLEIPSTALPLAVLETQRQAVVGSTTGLENATIGATLGILTERPRHERYAIENTRVQSFANWPPSRIPRPEELARAGFFYVGFGDNVKCFFCDGGLRNWEPQDDPWAEHARWFPRCGFVRQCKGDAFIRMIKEQNSPNNPAQTQTQRPQGAPGSYHVEAREIKARLDTPTVQAVLDMGFSRDAVRQAIEQRLRNTGDDFPSAATLLDAVLNIHDELNRQTAQGATAISVIPQEEHGQQPLNATLSEAPPREAAQKTSQTLNTDKLSKKDKKKKKKKQDAPVVKDSDDKETKSLIEENKRLKEERTCKICMDEEVSVVFLPCGHLVACVQCAPALRNCAICRAAIKGTVRSILS